MELLATGQWLYFRGELPTDLIPGSVLSSATKEPYGKLAFQQMQA